VADGGARAAFVPKCSILRRASFGEAEMCFFDDLLSILMLTMRMSLK
jgi:hypothetical protein